MSLIKIHKVFKTYGNGHAATQALRGIDLSIKPGEFVALSGSSGSGKTTLLNLAAGFDFADSGSVVFLERELSSLTEKQLALFRRKHVGFVFQMLNLLPTMTAFENIRISMALNGFSRSDQKNHALKLLEIAGLSDRADSFPKELSGGEQQRVAALRAVAHSPDLILLDEPTSSLDTGNAKTLLELLSNLNKEVGVTLIISTHDERIARLAKRRVILCDGKVVGDVSE